MASLKDRLKKKKAELATRGSGGNGIKYLKEGTIRVRPLPVGDEQEFVAEMVNFYLGSEIKGVFSPETINQPCAIMEAYQELKGGDEDDKEMAKGFSPKKRYLMPCLIYKDMKGKELEDDPVKLVQITNSLYQEIIDLYLDEDDWGDMTDPEDGFDLKLTRSGSGQFDTEYSVSPCPRNGKPILKKYHAPIDLEDMVSKIIPTYEETKEKINQYLGLGSEEEEEETPRRKKKTSSTGTKKRRVKKTRRSDI